RRVWEREKRRAALEIAGLGLVRELAVLNRAAPFPSVWPADLDPVGGCESLRHLLVDGVLPEDEGEGQDDAGAVLVDARQLVAQAVLDIVRVDAIVHDLERGVSACRHR